MTDPRAPFDPTDDQRDDEPTRREWLLRLGEITALAGVAGLVPDVATALTVPQQQAAAALPPGLYEPSTDHLTHVLGAQNAPMIPSGTETDYVRPRQGPLAPQFLSREELSMTRRVVQVLLGTVDSAVLDETVEWIDRHLAAAAGARRAARRLDPAHRALAVAHYGEARVADLETADPETDVRAALRQLDARARARFSRAFLQVEAAGQADLVREMSQARPDGPLGRGYAVLRRETVRGYYTTRAGLQDLNFKGNAYYGTCPGCNIG